ncbi:MAG: hypothetical protein QM731_05805 [Chitinophagaceae bacterium]
MYSQSIAANLFKNNSLMLHGIFGLVAGVSIAMIIYPVMHFAHGGGKCINANDVRMLTVTGEKQQGGLMKTSGLVASQASGSINTISFCNNSYLQETNADGNLLKSQ